jgi:CheY-like chemotaxis protein
VRNLLDFSRRRSATEDRADFAAVLRKALELKAHDLRKHNVAVVVELPKELPAARCDPHQLLQVVVNLVGNAEQAMYDADRGGRVHVRARTSRDRIVIRIADTGPGVPEQLRDRIFDPFFTTKEEGKGTGLGLGLCREILHRAGGTLHLCDSDSSGAAFEIGLPVAADGKRETERKPRSLPVLRGRRLLVVEDDPVCRSMVTEAFEATGNEVHSFDHSDPALRFLRSHWVDAVITDLHRPGSNGIEFHAEVRRIDEHLARRLLFLTGDTMNQELARFVSRANVPVLAKPVQIHELHAAVRKLLAPPRREQKTLFRGEH